MRKRRERGEWKYGECVEEAGVWGLDMEKGVTVEGAFGTDRGRERFLVRLFYRGEQREFKALADSGNRLREPVSGKPVSVVYIGDLKGFCDSVDGVVYIPYRAVGTRAGLLPAVIFEKMEIVWEKRTVEIQRPVVAVAREPLSGDGGFTMLIPEQFVV